MKNLPGKLQILFLALFIIFAFQCGFFYVSCVDIGFHLRTGELLFNQQRIPEINTFSFTQPRQLWFLHQWFPAAIYYVIFKAGGLTGLIAFKALLGVIIFLVIWLSSRNETGSRSFWPFWAASLSIMIARIRFFERPYMFSCIFLALLFYCLRKYKGSRLWEWLFLPVMMALWANTHIGVIYGFVLLGVFTLSNCCSSKKIASSDNFHATFTVNQR
ncbi:MAG: hypothetical protein KAV18_05755, partial [Candidatus Omnitrophica bacterium]|nr:hypothetical protein [Candidatus Omnitrophota bacterium]